MVLRHISKWIRFWPQRKYLTLFGVIIIILILIWISGIVLNTPTMKNFLAGDIVDFSNSDNITGYGYLIVPNVVHFIHFETQELSFVEMVCIKAAHLHQKPEKIIIHCDCHKLVGKYWDMVKNISNLIIVFVDKPTHVFGKPLSSVYHASDIARLQILMKYGGIFLDKDSYIVKSLDYYRKFEMAIGWPPNQNLGTQVIVAHKNARFLHLWYKSYRYYKGDRWYYNAGELPTRYILQYHPQLVHRVLHDFGVHNLINLLYGVRSSEWKSFSAIHLLIRHKAYLLPSDPVVEFDEEIIKTYNRTFGDMARLVVFGENKY